MALLIGTEASGSAVCMERSADELLKRIPTEVICLIFEQVSLSDIVACARSCKRFATVLRTSNYLWGVITQKRWPGALEHEVKRRFEGNWRACFIHCHTTGRRLRAVAPASQQRFPIPMPPGGFPATFGPPPSPFAALAAQPPSLAPGSFTKDPVWIHATNNYLALADRSGGMILDIAKGTWMAPFAMPTCEGIQISGEHLLVKQITTALLYAVDSAWDQSPSPLSTYSADVGFLSCARKFGSDVLISTRAQERPLPLLGSYQHPASLLCLDAETKDTKWKHTEELSTGELSAIEHLPLVNLYATMRSSLNGGVRLLDARDGNSVRCIAAGWDWNWAPNRLPPPGVARPIIACYDNYIAFGGFDVLEIADIRTYRTFFTGTIVTKSASTPLRYASLTPTQLHCASTDGIVHVWEIHSGKRLLWQSNTAFTGAESTNAAYPLGARYFYVEEKKGNRAVVLNDWEGATDINHYRFTEPSAAADPPAPQKSWKEIAEENPCLPALKPLRFADNQHPANMEVINLCAVGYHMEELRSNWAATSRVQPLYIWRAVRHLIAVTTNHFYRLKTKSPAVKASGNCACAPPQRPLTASPMKHPMMGVSNIGVHIHPLTPKNLSVPCTWCGQTTPNAAHSCNQGCTFNICPLCYAKAYGRTISPATTPATLSNQPLVHPGILRIPPTASVEAALAALNAAVEVLPDGTTRPAAPTPAPVAVAPAAVPAVASSAATPPPVAASTVSAASEHPASSRSASLDTQASEDAALSSPLAKDSKSPVAPALPEPAVSSVPVPDEHRQTSMQPTLVTPTALAVESSTAAKDSVPTSAQPAATSAAESLPTQTAAPQPTASDASPTKPSAGSVFMSVPVVPVASAASVLSNNATLPAATSAASTAAPTSAAPASSSPGSEDSPPPSNATAASVAVASSSGSPLAATMPATSSALAAPAVSAAVPALVKPFNVSTIEQLHPSTTAGPMFSLAPAALSATAAPAVSSAAPPRSSVPFTLLPASIAATSSVSAPMKEVVPMRAPGRNPFDPPKPGASAAALFSPGGTSTVPVVTPSLFETAQTPVTFPAATTAAADQQTAPAASLPGTWSLFAPTSPAAANSPVFSFSLGASKSGKKEKETRSNADDNLPFGLVLPPISGVFSPGSSPAVSPAASSPFSFGSSFSEPQQPQQRPASPDKQLPALPSIDSLISGTSSSTKKPAAAPTSAGGDPAPTLGPARPELLHPTLGTFGSLSGRPLGPGGVASTQGDSSTEQRGGFRTLNTGFGGRQGGLGPEQNLDLRGFGAQQGVLGQGGFGAQQSGFGQGGLGAQQGGFGGFGGGLGTPQGGGFGAQMQTGGVGPQQGGFGGFGQGGFGNQQGSFGAQQGGFGQGSFGTQQGVFSGGGFGAQQGGGFGTPQGGFGAQQGGFGGGYGGGFGGRGGRGLGRGGFNTPAPGPAPAGIPIGRGGMRGLRMVTGNSGRGAGTRGAQPASIDMRLDVRDCQTVKPARIFSDSLSRVTISFTFVSANEQRVWFDLPVDRKLTALELYDRVAQCLSPRFGPFALVHRGQIIPRTRPDPAPLSLASAVTLLEEFKLAYGCWLCIEPAPAFPSGPVQPPVPEAPPQDLTEEEGTRPGIRRRFGEADAPGNANPAPSPHPLQPLQLPPFGPQPAAPKDASNLWAIRK